MSDYEVSLSDKYSEISFWEKHQNKLLSEKEWSLDMEFDGEEIPYLLFISQGRYRELFEYASLNTKKVTDFHHLYHSISDILMAVILFHGFNAPDYFEMLKNCDKKTEKILYAYQKEIEKLDILFYEYTEQLEIEYENNAPVSQFIDMIKKIDTKIDKQTETQLNTTECIKALNEINAKVDKIDKQTEIQTMTEYDIALMDNGSIDKNFNAIHSAPKIAERLIDLMLMTDLKPEIIQRYKKNGKPFSLETARKAVLHAKTNAKKKEAGTK